MPDHSTHFEATSGGMILTNAFGIGQGLLCGCCGIGAANLVLDCCADGI